MSTHAVLPEGFETVEDVFTYGYCHALALVLNERTGWDIVGLYNPRDGYADHFLVRRPDGVLVDVMGERSAEDVLKAWGEVFYSVREYASEVLWAESERGDMEDPRDVWLLAQETAQSLL